MLSTGRRPTLVTGKPDRTAESLVVELRRLGRRTVWADTSESARALIDEIDFEMIVVLVEREADWAEWEWLPRAVACPVIIGSPLLARDRRYRRRAFGAGARAYMSTPYTRRRLREVISRVGDGEAGVELVQPPVFLQGHP